MKETKDSISAINNSIFQPLFILKKMSLKCPSVCQKSYIP